ncbi:hypothetical protein PAMP_000925 [Pampus punctatissimus]
MKWWFLCWLILCLVSRSDQSNSNEKSDQSGSNEKSDQSGSNEKSDQSGLNEKSDQSGSNEKSDQSNSNEKSDQSGSNEKSDQLNSNEKSDQSGSNEKSDQSGSNEKSDQSNSNEKSDQSGSNEKSDQSGSNEKSDQSGSNEKSDQSGSNEKSDQSNSNEKSDQSGSNEKSDQSNSNEKSDQSGSNEKSDQSGSNEKSDQSGSNEKSDQSNSNEKSDQSGSNEKSDQSGSNEKSDQSGSNEKSDQSNSNEKSDQSGSNEKSDQSGSNEKSDQSGSNEKSDQSNSNEKSDQSGSNEMDDQSGSNEMDERPPKGKRCENPPRRSSDARSCMEDVTLILQSRELNSTIKAMKKLEIVLEETELNETTYIYTSHSVAALYKPKGLFKGLQIHASDTEVMSGRAVAGGKVSVQLPSELDVGSNNTIVFFMLTWPGTDGNILGASDTVYERRLISLRVRAKNISGLHERVNITMNLTMGINETKEPSCVFFNFSSKKYSTDGCLTLWKHGNSHVTCSCDHFTYFAVLMVSASLSATQLKVLTHISLIGCSISLFALTMTILLFITKRKVDTDVSIKVHINLVIALILLNLHFLPSESVAALSSSGFCLYMALLLHYSLLATFSWMAVEGIHLYLLLVKVFNIYIRKYILKLSLVGWGIPAVIVSLVVIIDRDAYGRFPYDLSNHNTSICYIRNDTVKIVTTYGVFGLVFVLNLIMLGVIVRRVVSLRHCKEFGQSNSDRIKRDICTLLGISTLLGITWGLAFFSFGYLTVPGIYLFSILNSLQGLFIFLWFVMSFRKSGIEASKRSSETHSTNSCV